MSTRSRLPLKLAATVLAAACAAGGVAAARQGGHPHPVALTAFAAPAPPARTTAASTRQAPARNFKKGVSAWAFPGARSALAQSGVHWYYTWATSHDGISTPKGVSFVPMIWGAGSVTTASLQQARRSAHVLLAFNEPDMSSQSNLTVASALNLWPKLMATGLELGSPAVADNAATPGGWLDQFMRGAAARGYRVNFITVHWYGTNFATSAAVSELRSYLQAIYQRYHLPIWITELGLVSYGATPTYPTDGQQAAFVGAAASMLASLGYVQRYAWFALPVSSGDGNMGLFSSGPVVTQVGRAFEAAGR